MQIILILVATVIVGVIGTLFLRQPAPVANNTDPTPIVEVKDTPIEETPGPVVQTQDAVASETPPVTEKPPQTQSSAPPKPTPAPSSGTGGQTQSPPVVSTRYANGTYDANGTYFSPGGKESVALSLTIKDDIVTSATFTADSRNGTSERYQNKFKAGYQALVVGKPLDSINLTVVNGSSLTPRGFMDALADIKAEAKA